MFQGIDTAARLSAAQAAILAKNGVSFAGRYLVDPAMSKALTADEARILRDAGLAVLLIWETYANRAREGAAAGRSDGALAAKFAGEMGVPAGCAIFFAVDYDAPKSDFSRIQRYLNAAKAACSPYRCGVYGKAELIDNVKADAYMQCVAWSGGAVSPRAQIYQYEWQGGASAKALAAKIGVAVDLDSCADPRAAGLWTAAPAPWYADTVAWAEKEGVASGGRPEDPATRAEVMQMIRNYNRRFEEEDPAPLSGALADD